MCGSEKTVRKKQEERERAHAFHSVVSFRTGRELLEVHLRPMFSYPKTFQAKGRGVFFIFLFL